jgi:hypothetical protein
MAWLVRAGRAAPMLLAFSAASGLAVHGTAWQAALSTTRAAHRLIILDEADPHSHPAKPSGDFTRR